jgi:hypothetical protein
MISSGEGIEDRRQLNDGPQDIVGPDEIPSKAVLHVRPLRRDGVR